MNQIQRTLLRKHRTKTSQTNDQTHWTEDNHARIQSQWHKELSQEDSLPLGQLTIDKVRLIRLKTHRLDKS